MTASLEVGWRAPILAHFSRESAAAGRLTVVLDPDGLLTEPRLVELVKAHGFELLTFTDHVRFRYLYESRFRSRWDQGEDTHLVVALRTETDNERALPYDLVEEARSTGRLLPLNLAELFPCLAPNIVAQLDRGDFDALAEAIRRFAPERLGENDTRDFILRHVFEVAPELVKTPSDLLRMLLQRHYRSRSVPADLDARLISLLTDLPGWRAWPLERIVPSKEAFLRFLEERWPFFLRTRGFPFVEGREPAQPAIAGPKDLPFDHDDVRVYIDNLFAEGLLQATTAVASEKVKGTWHRIGVVGPVVENAAVRLIRLVGTLLEELPDEDANHLAWSGFGMRWAEAVSLRWQLGASAPEDLLVDLLALHDRLEERFSSWMQRHYAALVSLPELPRPTTLDKVARFLAYHRAQRQRRVALLVVDGLALDQWLVLRESLADLRLEEATAFAWVPTLTAVSRQAIFAGEPPHFFGQHLSTTQKEPRHWARFWEEQGLAGPAVGYLCQKQDESDEALLARVNELAEDHRTKVLGVVVGTIDRMLHGIVTGTGGLHASVRHWAEHGHFAKLVRALLAQGFEVFMTADHGNVEGIGIGKPNVGAIAQERGERVHVFEHELLRARVQEAYPGSLAWPQVALPEDYRPLLAPGRGAFLPEGARAVSHGGLALEEVLVPFVKLAEAQ